jgi:hypothetical protein
MLATTIEVMKASLKADPTVTPADRARVLALLRNGEPKQGVPQQNVERIRRRADAAERFSVSTRTMDRWAKQGVLAKIKLPGHSRASGFREADLTALIAGRAA